MNNVSREEIGPEEGGFWSDTVRFMAISLLVILPIRLFIAQPFIVSGASMAPTFHNGEYLIVDELSYRLAAPERGDVVIFKYPIDPSLFFIKRIIGLPGETVELSNGKVTITTTAGERVTLDEPYVAYPLGDTITQTLEANQYFVMGDNRAESFDSRRWGALSSSDLVGRALVRLFPFDKISLEPGKAHFEIAAPKTDN